MNFQPVLANLLLFLGTFLLLGGIVARRFITPTLPALGFVGLGFSLVGLGVAWQVGWTLYDLGYFTWRDALAYLTSYPPGRTALLTLLGAILLLVAELNNWPDAFSGLLALLFLWGVAGSGHGGAHGPSTQGMTALHVAAMSVWLGGVFALLRQGELTAPQVRRFTPVALTCLTVLILSGAILALEHSGSYGALLASPYGLVLIGKIGVMLLALLAAFFVRQAVQRQVSARRALIVETLLLLGVLLVTAFLTNLPPPSPEHNHGQVTSWLA